MRLLSFLLTVFHLSANAVILPLQARSGPDPATLRRRGSTSTIQNLTSLSNTQYVTNITIAGVELAISLDTGRFVKLILVNQLCFMTTTNSFDLWASFPGTVPTASITDTGKSLKLGYAVGSASGS